MEAGVAKSRKNGLPPINRSLLYEQGYTIGSARLQLSETTGKETTKCD